MDDLLKRRMYIVLVKKYRLAGLPKTVEMDVTPIADLCWNIGYKKSPSPDDRLYVRSGRPEPATSQPEVKLFSAWKNFPRTVSMSSISRAS